MAAHDLHGELFEGTGAMNLGLMRLDNTIAFTTVVVDGAGGTRAHLPIAQARAAWYHLGELLGMDDTLRELVEVRARDLAREWIRMDDNDRAELRRLRDELAEKNGTRVGG